MLRRVLARDVATRGAAVAAAGAELKAVSAVGACLTKYHASKLIFTLNSLACYTWSSLYRVNRLGAFCLPPSAAVALSLSVQATV